MPSLDIVTVHFPREDDASRGEGGDPLASLMRPYKISDGTVGVSRACLRLVADLAGAGVEQRNTAVDRHGRVPSTENPLVAAGREREPVVSTAAAALRAAVVQAAGRRPVLTIAPWPDGRRWAAAFTHDVDVVAAWPVFTGLRLVELARRRRPTLAASVIASALRQAGTDPVARGVRGVLDIEHRAAVASTWFVLCGTPSWTTFRRGDLTYSPDSPHARAVLGAVQGAGHEIGLHASFATMDHGEVFISQRARLGQLVGRPPAGVRQHFLRMRPGATQRAMTAAEFAYDATYGFPDRNGFRLGVADIVPAWDVAAGTRTGLDEAPLIWMDRAQSKYQGVEDPERWIEDGLELAAATRGVDGLWVGLWHPNLTPALGFPGAPEAYARLVTSIVAQEPYIAPLEHVVAWRRLRRAVRAIDVRGQGVTIETPSPRSFDVSIVDAAGRRVTTIQRDDSGRTGATTQRVALR